MHFPLYKSIKASFASFSHVRCVSYGVKLLYLRAENTLFNRVRVKTKPVYPIVSCRGRVACPKTQNKLFSGERTSPLRTKRQHYPRFDIHPQKPDKSVVLFTPLHLPNNRKVFTFSLFTKTPFVPATSKVSISKANPR